ncbi:uncharacterized protein EI90DRAFT_2906895, partial [Cantharellus anzutake]|uniref:uncharacterized protein n=1 Tax=Cantharellus anzutake TaxID=1750568 RepID=UPI001906FB6D
LIPILVILSGILAGLTLGYMSLDETQLRVLSVSGSHKQQEYAQKIQPIRKNGHLLLTTLLLGNMIVNETLPVLSEKVLGGGLQAVIVSTVLIVVFAEIIPQSLCSRFGLQIGAFMAVPTRILMYALFVIAWPIAKLLEISLGPHHGIVYRRDGKCIPYNIIRETGKLKELINMHAVVGHHGGDLQSDTVTIVGGALDFQVKTVHDAMTPIDDVLMLSIDAKLDYETLAKVVRSGHSRVPVYEPFTENNGTVTKTIIGVLLVKQCILLDPEDATPLRDIPLNSVPTVPFDEPLLHTLDRFQQGKSHMAVVSRIPTRTESKAKPGSVNDEAKVGLTRRFLNRVGFGDDSSNGSSDSDTEGDEKSKGSVKRRAKGGGKKGRKELVNAEKPKQIPSPWLYWNNSVALEQTMPSDAILDDENATKVSRRLAPMHVAALSNRFIAVFGRTSTIASWYHHP